MKREMGAKNRLNFLLVGVLLVVLIVVVYQSMAATTIGTNFSTDGTLTVNGASTLNANTNINFTTSENLAFDWGSSPNAEGARTAYNPYTPAQVHRASSTSPFVANLWDATGSSTGGPGLFYNLITRNANSVADSFDIFGLHFTNNGDSGDRVRMIEIKYDDSSTQPANFMTQTYMVMLDMDENVNNLNFPNGLVVEAGGGSDDAGIDNLLTTAIDVSDPDITQAISIGDNLVRLGSVASSVLNLRSGDGENGLVTIAASDGGDSTAHLRLAPGGTGRLELGLRQADLGVASCTQGEMALDTGGATKELCFCQGANTWYCWNATTVTGPTD